MSTWCVLCREKSKGISETSEPFIISDHNSFVKWTILHVSSMSLIIPLKKRSKKNSTKSLDLLSVVKNADNGKSYLNEL